MTSDELTVSQSEAKNAFNRATKAQAKFKRDFHQAGIREHRLLSCIVSESPFLARNVTFFTKLFVCHKAFLLFVKSEI